MTDSGSDQLAPTWLEIDGWDIPQPCAVRLETAAELALARRIVAHETRQLDRRLHDLERRLKPDSVQFAAVQKSKQRPQFDLVVRPARNALPARPAERLRALITPPATTLAPTPLEQSAGQWLADRFPRGGRIVMVGADSAPSPLGGQPTSRFEIVRVAAGEGNVSPSRSRMASRHRANANSLAGWLATHSQEDAHSIAAFVLGEGATQKDVDLLRFRVQPEQVVVAAHACPATASLLQSWGGNAYSSGDQLILTHPGPSFVDPATLPVSPADAKLWPRISVVTVSYNQAQFLERCLKSVLDQDYPNLEYIVVDAVSNDGSQDILRRYESRLSKLVIEPDRGQSDGLNKGFDLATGEILTWINSDDALAPGALKRAAVAFAHHGSDLVAGGCERIGSRDEMLDRHYAALPFVEPLPLGFAHQYVWESSWAQGDYFYQPEVLFTADIWRRSGGSLKLHLHWAMDWELWIRMALASATITQIPVTLGISRLHPNQKTTTDELYLYQLKNILMEHADALAAVAAAASDIPTGTPVSFRPERVTRTKIEQLAARVWKLRHPTYAKGVIANRLGPGFVDRVQRLRYKARYGMGGFRLISGSGPAAISRMQRLLQSYEAETRQARLEHADLKQALADRSGRVRDLTELVATASRRIADYWSRLLFDAPAEARTAERVQAMLATHDMQDIARAIARDNASQQSSRAFAAARHLLVKPAELPDRDRFAQTIGRLRVVTIGNAGAGNCNYASATLEPNWSTVTIAHNPALGSLDAALALGEHAGATIDLLIVRAGPATIEMLHGAGNTLRRTIVCRIEAGFATVAGAPPPFADIDALMRAEGFALLDLAHLDKRRNTAFDHSRGYSYHAGRLVAAECIYVRCLDQLDRLSVDERTRLAVVAHETLQKYDVASAALGAIDPEWGERYARAVE
ncbi:MAG: glycosyltransferase family 2 protein [Pseudomonadota bacterium]